MTRHLTRSSPNLRPRVPDARPARARTFFGEHAVTCRLTQRLNGSSLNLRSRVPDARPARVRIFLGSAR